ncbi:MAG: hypothetical protein R2748_15045 [Bryobacterales bacterium]
MAAVVSIVVLLILALCAGLIHIPLVRDFALEKSRQYLSSTTSTSLSRRTSLTTTYLD